MMTAAAEKPGLGLLPPSAKIKKFPTLGISPDCNVTGGTHPTELSANLISLTCPSLYFGGPYTVAGAVDDTEAVLSKGKAPKEDM